MTAREVGANLQDTQALALVYCAVSLVAGLFPALLALRLWLSDRRATRGKEYE